METDTTLDLGRAHVYRFLAAAVADPHGRHFDLALDRRLQTVALAAAELLASEAPIELTLAPGERHPARLDLGPVVQALAVSGNALRRQHREVFGLVLGKSAPPNETEYCRSTLTFHRSQQLADIAGFYRAFQLELNREEPERPDHLSVELEFLAHLIDKELAAADAGLVEKAGVCRVAQRKFLEDHLAWWVPAFAELLRRAAPGGLYAALAPVLGAFIAAERAVLRVQPAHQLAEPKPETNAPEDQSCCEVPPCLTKL